MSKNSMGRQILVAIVLTLTAECMLLLSFGWAGSVGWIDSEQLFPAVMAAVVMASAAGSCYLAGKKWSAVPSGAICGILTQLILLLAGYLVFGSTEFKNGRWCLPVAGFFVAMLVNLLAAKRGGKKRRSRKATLRRKRA